MNTKKEILSGLKKHLEENYAGSVRDVILFGSQAQGRENEDSDYDILIILNNEYNDRDKNTILDLCYDIDLKYDILIDVHILSVNELSSLRGRQPVFANAVKSGIYA